MLLGGGSSQGGRICSSQLVCFFRKAAEAVVRSLKLMSGRRGCCQVGETVDKLLRMQSGL